MEEKIFKKFLKDRGQRLTRERAAILRKTSSSQGHFDPESLYLEMKKKSLKISRASVYRTLHILCECGLIEKVKKTEHGTIYEKTYGQGHHDHMLCLSCGEVIEFYSEDLERLQKDLCKKYGFQWTNHTLEIQGYCKKCLKKTG
ncbi:MAG: transcriptional repressor [Nitrospirae bacterium]|nr:transcriptional repressor [Nitrospirota bacterium]